MTCIMHLLLAAIIVLMSSIGRTHPLSAYIPLSHHTKMGNLRTVDAELNMKAAPFTVCNTESVSMIDSLRLNVPARETHAIQLKKWKI